MNTSPFIYTNSFQTIRFPKSIRKIVERCKIDTPYTELYDRSLSWLSTDTSIKSGGFNKFYWFKIVTSKQDQFKQENINEF
jgi:hypothetical protein